MEGFGVEMMECLGERGEVAGAIETGQSGGLLEVGVDNAGEGEARIGEDCVGADLAHSSADDEEDSGLLEWSCHCLIWFGLLWSCL